MACANIGGVLEALNVDKLAAWHAADETTGFVEFN